MCISRKGNSPLRLANEVQGACFFVSPFPLVVLPKAKLMIDDLKGVPILNGRANSGWRWENPPEEETFTRTLNRVQEHVAARFSDQV